MSDSFPLTQESKRALGKQSMKKVRSRSSVGHYHSPSLLFSSQHSFLLAFTQRIDVYFAGDETQRHPSGLRGGQITVAEKTHTHRQTH